jgi:hypothetical protein
VLAGVVDIGGLLVSTRQSEFGRSMHRIYFQRVLESIDGLRKVFGLYVYCAEKIPCVSVVWIDLDYVTERDNRRLSVARILGKQSEVIPRVGIFGILLECIFQQRLCFVDLLQIQKRDTFVQLCDRELGVEIGRLLEGL